MTDTCGHAEHAIGPDGYYGRTVNGAEWTFCRHMTDLHNTLIGEIRLGVVVHDAVGSAHAGNVVTPMPTVGAVETPVTDALLKGDAIGHASDHRGQP